MHIYRKFNTQDAEYIDCNTGEIYSWDKLQEFKSSGMDIYYHRTFNTFMDYMKKPADKYNHFGTPIEI